MGSFCLIQTRCFLRQVLTGLPAVMHREYSLDISAQLLRSQGYVDGRWISAASSFSVLDPATGEEIAKVADCGPSEAKTAVDAAYKAFYSWKQYTAKVLKLFIAIRLRSIWSILSQKATLSALTCIIALSCLQCTVISCDYLQPWPPKHCFKGNHILLHPCVTLFGFPTNYVRTVTFYEMLLDFVEVSCHITITVKLKK